jgi:hypothetical protein
MPVLDNDNKTPLLRPTFPPNREFRDGDGKPPFVDLFRSVTVTSADFPSLSDEEQVEGMGIAAWTFAAIAIAMIAALALIVRAWL